MLYSKHQLLRTQFWIGSAKCFHYDLDQFGMGYRPTVDVYKSFVALDAMVNNIIASLK